MRRAHAPRAQASSGSGAATAVILVLVVGVGVFVYVTMTKGDEGTRTPGRSDGPRTASPPAPPREAPPAAPDASGVVEEYDAAHDRSKTSVRDLTLRAEGGERWTLGVSWSNPGRARQRPSSPVVWSITRVAMERALSKAHDVEVTCDARPIGVRGSSYDSQSTADGMVEVVRFSSSLDDLLRAAAATKIVARVGGRDLELPADAMGALRALAARVPEK